MRVNTTNNKREETTPPMVALLLNIKVHLLLRASLIAIDISGVGEN